VSSLAQIKLFSTEEYDFQQQFFRWKPLMRECGLLYCKIARNRIGFSLTVFAIGAVGSYPADGPLLVSCAGYEK
jgi:hypothetical protein